MEVSEAKAILGRVGPAVPTAEWNTELITAVQRALARLWLLNPDDDVDGLMGSRTRDAWRFFKEATSQADAGTIERGSAGLLTRAVDDPVGFVGQLRVDLQEDFAFRRRERRVNRDKSVAAIVAAAKARRLSRPQIAYILATAEHESDAFNTLEEYSDGRQYEGRRDLQNTQPGDGPRFKGRGYVQLTGRRNYTTYASITGIDLVKLPALLMNWAALSVFVIVDGMMRGVYTGRRLDEFVNAGQTDFFNARMIVNGHDRAEKIADQANDWMSQLD